MVDFQVTQFHVTFTKSLKICHSLSYKERLLKCDLFSLERRRLFADLVFFYKIVNNLINIDVSGEIKPIRESKTRGQSKRFIIPTARLNCRKNFFYQSCNSYLEQTE